MWHESCKMDGLALSREYLTKYYIYSTSSVLSVIAVAVVIKHTRDGSPTLSAKFTPFHLCNCHGVVIRHTWDGSIGRFPNNLTTLAGHHGTREVSLSMSMPVTNFVFVGAWYASAKGAWHVHSSKGWCIYLPGKHQMSVWAGVTPHPCTWEC